MKSSCRVADILLHELKHCFLDLKEKSPFLLRDETSTQTSMKAAFDPSLKIVNHLILH